MKIKSGKNIINQSGTPSTTYRNIETIKYATSPTRRPTILIFSIAPSFINYNR